MKKNLGSAKINFPKLEKVVYRQRLFKQLDDSQDKLITWISGPPGAGKTTLVSSYITERKKSYLWVRCDKTDNDIGSFISYLSLAAEQTQRGLGKSLPAFIPEYAGDVEPFLRNYLRTLIENLKYEVTIVLDDFHEVQVDSALKRSIPALADEFNNMHSLIVISRKPALESLARIQVSQQLNKIDWHQLQLTEAETQNIVAQQGNAQDQKRVKLLHKLSKGWIAALKLILLGGRNADFEEPSTEDQLDQTLFFNYLAQETFNHLSQEKKQALIELALAPSMTKQHLALAASENFNSDQIEQLLSQQLVQKFSVPVTHYKFHPLYKEFLLQQVSEIISDSSRKNIMLASAEILHQHKLPSEAADLFMQLNQHEKLIELVLEYGDEMNKQGRYVELENWISVLPKIYVEQEPWLRYWYAASLLATDQARSQEYFVAAFKQFCEVHDVRGIYMSWAGALEACLYSFEDFSFVGKWMEKLESIRKAHPKFPSLEIRMRVIGARMFAYFMGYTHSDNIESTLKTCYRLVRFVPVPMLRVLVGTGLAWAYVTKGDGAKFTKVISLIRPHIDNSSIAPFHRITACLPIAYHDWSYFPESIAEYSQKGIDLAENVGIHHFDGVLLDHKALSYYAKGYLDKAERILNSISSESLNSHGINYAAISQTFAVVAVTKGQVNQAREIIEDCIEVALEKGLLMPHASFLNIYAEILSEQGEFEKAFKNLEDALIFAESIESKMLKYHSYLSYAFVALNNNDHPLLLDSLTKAFSLGKENNIYAVKGFIRPNILKLCIAAYEHDIELDYTAKLVELFNFTYPDHLPVIERWPFRLKVRVFDNISVSTDGGDLVTKSKSQNKVFELLQVLVAMGGKNIEAWRIAEVLWNDSEGDIAHRNLETTTHRLRKLIGKELVIVKNNKLTLSREQCWTDVWQFDAIVVQLDKLLNKKTSTDEIYIQVKQLMNIYTGALLRDVDAPWLKFYREKYIAEFLRSIDRAIDYLQAHSKFEQVIELTHQASLRAPERENFYLQAMLSYQAMGQNSKALDVFRRCEEVFRQTQGSSLSSQILELTDSLR